MTNFDKIKSIFKLRSSSRPPMEWHLPVILNSGKKYLPKGVNILLGQPVDKQNSQLLNWLLISWIQLDKKAEPRKKDEDESEEKHDPRERRDTNCTIFLGYTSNLISSGLRDTLRFLAQHNLVS